MLLPVARRHVRRAIIVAGVPVLAAYWLALALGADSPLITHWVFLLQLAVPTALVIGRAVALREERVAWGALGTGLALWTAGFAWQAAADLRGAAPGFPGPADALWLLAYPCPFV